MTTCLSWPFRLVADGAARGETSFEEGAKDGSISKMILCGGAISVDGEGLETEEEHLDGEVSMPVNGSML